MITDKRPAPKTEAQQRAEAKKAEVLWALRRLTRIVDTNRSETFDDLQALTQLYRDISDLYEFETRR